MDSKSCSTLYTSGRSSYESHAEWNEKFTELINIEHGLNLSREEYMQSAEAPNYHDASKLIRNREISPISLYKQVVKNRLRLLDALKKSNAPAVIIDLNRAIAAYDNYLHDKGMPSP